MGAFEQIDAVFNAPEMSRELEFALSVMRDRLPDDELAAMIARVEGKFESSRNYPVVLQFMQDHSKLVDREVIRLFEFIYSSMVNKFKGELGEALARPSLLAFQRMLAKPADLVLGAEIASRQLRRRNGWYPAADALYCVRGEAGIEIVAIAEVKSKGTPFAEMRQQVEANLVRLRRGLRMDGVEIPPEQIFIRTCGGASVPATRIESAVARDVETLMIVPFRSATSEVPAAHPADARVWLAELPWRQDDITEAAYRLMSWYFSRVGPKVFYLRGAAPAVPDNRRPAAHEELSLEENGKHAFLEAIYLTTERRGFDPLEIPPHGRRTPWQTLLWLYNSLGFGYEQASTKEFMFPEFTPTEASKVRLAQHDAAVTAYRAGRLGDALAQLPDPAEQTDRWWARREWIMLARIHARSGDTAKAREALARATAMPPIESLSLPIEIAGVDALIVLAERDVAATKRALEAARMMLDRVRAEVQTHEENGWEFPSDIEPNSAREGIIDLAVAHAALGDCHEVLALLRRLRRLRGWELDFFAADPLLARCTADARVLADLRERTARTDGLAIF